MSRTGGKEEWKAYSHHGTRAGASNEDLLGVGVVLLEGVRDHVSNGIAVTTTVVLQRLLRRDVPASSALILLLAYIHHSHEVSSLTWGEEG
jgi:hypothetical protein